VPEQRIEIELVKLRKTYNEVVAVDESSLRIGHGEFFSLLGPSGCGKTTTLRLIAGLEQPTAGRVFLAGEDVTDKPAYQRNVNTVFQDYALFPHMNVRENVYFPLKMRRIRPSAAEPLIREILELVDMAGFERRLPLQLSGGQRQRIALARSLVNRPAALLLDEPLGALDFKLRVAMQKVLKDIQRDVDITFVYVTHDQTEAITMSDRICVMKDGYIHQIGTPDEVYNAPATAFVASFIGDMNFLEGTITELNGGTAAVAVDGARLICSRVVGAPGRGGQIHVCIRPQNISIVRAGAVETRHENRLQGRVTRVVFRGDDFEITVARGSSEIRLVYGASSSAPAKIGDELLIGFDSKDVTVYPKISERQ
jgi:spermidine/putrescine transport system ATP-binding protein